MINKLIEIIGREAELFESFLELLEHQKEMLVKNNLEGISRITEAQREKLVQSQLLNKQRLEIIESIKADRNIEGDLNVTRLLDLVDQDQADRLVKLQKLILTLNDKITESRNKNVMLLNRSREYIFKTMEMLSRVHSPEMSYTPTGKGKSQHLNVAVDRRA